MLFENSERDTTNRSQILRRVGFVGLTMIFSETIMANSPE
ncbi:MAG: hypothetical protein ACJAT6_001583 [Akkermansiaceae bacterium]|jgi:hypothetical protein